jgi:hypothetical protein
VGHDGGFVVIGFAIAKTCRASLDWTAEGGCPHMFFSFFSSNLYLMLFYRDVRSLACKFLPGRFLGLCLVEAGLQLATGRLRGRCSC